MVAFLHYKDGSKLSHSCAGMMGRERERASVRAKIWSENRGRLELASASCLGILDCHERAHLRSILTEGERESEQTFYASNFKSKFNYLKNSTIQNAPIR